MVTAAECTRSRYLYTYSLVAHQGSCYVTYENMDSQFTWYEAAVHCMKLGGHLASFDTQNTQVSFFDAQYIPQQCAWIGLVKKFFYWTTIQRLYSPVVVLLVVVVVALASPARGHRGTCPHRLPTSFCHRRRSSVNFGGTGARHFCPKIGLYA